MLYCDIVLFILFHLLIYFYVVMFYAVIHCNAFCLANISFVCELHASSSRGFPTSTRALPKSKGKYREIVLRKSFGFCGSLELRRGSV